MLHDAQLKVMASPAPYKVLAAGRRFGKTRNGLQWALDRVMEFDQPIDPQSWPCVLLGAPTMTQGYPVLWEPLERMLNGAPFVKKIDRTRKTIYFKGNKPFLKVAGANDRNGDGLRGLKLYALLADEFADWKDGIFEYVVQPALGDTPNSQCLLQGTPKGKAGDMFRYYELGQGDDPDWASFQFPSTCNPYIDPRVIERAKKTMSTRAYLQEWEASFENFAGAIFSELNERHRRTIEPNHFLLGLDWGDVHPCIMVTAVGGSAALPTYCLWDYWQPVEPVATTESEQIENILKFIRQYNIRGVMLPDDRTGAIKTLIELGHRKNIPCLKAAYTVKRNDPGIDESLETLNNLFKCDRLFIHPKHEKLYNNFQAYHRALENNMIVATIPKGQNSHPIDSARYTISPKEYKRFRLSGDDFQQ